MTVEEAAGKKDSPDHANAVAKDWDKVWRHVRHGRVGIGQEHIVADLDGSWNDQELIKSASAFSSK